METFKIVEHKLQRKYANDNAEHHEEVFNTRADSDVEPVVPYHASIETLRSTCSAVCMGQVNDPIDALRTSIGNVFQICGGSFTSPCFSSGNNLSFEPSPVTLGDSLVTVDYGKQLGGAAGGLVRGALLNASDRFQQPPHLREFPHKKKAHRVEHNIHGISDADVPLPTAMEWPVDQLDSATIFTLGSAHSLLAKEYLKVGNRKKALRILDIAVSLSCKDPMATPQSALQRILERATAYLLNSHPMLAAHDYMTALHAIIHERKQQTIHLEQDVHSMSNEERAFSKKVLELLREVQYRIAFNATLALRCQGCYEAAEAILRYSYDIPQVSNTAIVTQLLPHRLRLVFELCRLIRCCGGPHEVVHCLALVGTAMDSSAPGVLGLVQIIVQYYLSQRSLSHMQDMSCGESESVNYCCNELLRLVTEGKVTDVTSCAETGGLPAVVNKADVYVKHTVITILDFATSYLSLDMWNSVANSSALSPHRSNPGRQQPKRDIWACASPRQVMRENADWTEPSDASSSFHSFTNLAYENGPPLQPTLNELPLDLLPQLIQEYLTQCGGNKQDLQSVVIPIDIAPEISFDYFNQLPAAPPKYEAVSDSHHGEGGKESTTVGKADSHSMDMLGSIGTTASTVYQSFCPNVEGLKQKQPLLTDAQREVLHQELPLNMKGNHWTCLYSTNEHGYSINTLYSLVADWEPEIIVVRDDVSIYGAYLGDAIKLCRRPYGSRESFVFSLRDADTTELEIYRWPDRCNEYFCLATPKSLSIGGGPKGSAILIHESLTSGNTYPCDTFASPPLSAVKQPCSPTIGSSTTTDEERDLHDVELYVIEVYGINIAKKKCFSPRGSPK